MAAIAELMKAGIWFDRQKYEEAEYKYQEYLVRHTLGNKSVEVVKKSQVADRAGGNLSQQIKQARQKIQNLTASPATTTPEDADSVRKQVDALTKENERLRDAVASMTKRFEAIENRLSALERSSPQAAAPAKEETTAAEKPLTNGTAEDDDDDDDDDIDLFGSDDEEEDAEAARIREERLKAYHEKKAKKPTVIAKSNIILDVKPWDDETNMEELEKCVRSVEMDGLLWGASKLVKIAFGIQKLQITCVVEDDKVGTDDLDEKITGFEDYVQSVDIVAFNKI